MTFTDYYLIFTVFLFGACWGSFLNVCIYRIPEEKSVVKPRSSCPKCGYMIPWYDNIPMFSWLMLGGKCRQCKVRISPRYFGVELLTAILFCLIWFRFPIWTEATGFISLLAVPYTLLVFGLILGTFVDIDHMILPDRVTIGGMIVGPIFSLLLPEMHGVETHMEGLLQSVYGGALGFGLLWSVGAIGKLVLKKDAMGFGDVKLMGTLGAFLGMGSIPFIVFISSLFGATVGITCIVAGKSEWSGKIPFGPYIALAAVIWMLGGSGWWDLYVNWLTGAM